MLRCFVTNFHKRTKLIQGRRALRSSEHFFRLRDSRITKRSDFSQWKAIRIPPKEKLYNLSYQHVNSKKAFNSFRSTHRTNMWINLILVIATVVFAWISLVYDLLQSLQLHSL